MLALLVTKDRQKVLEAIPKLMKRVTGGSRYGFTKDNSILTNSIASYAEWYCRHGEGNGYGIP